MKDNSAQFPFLKRKFPPSHPIRRENLIQVNPDKFRELLTVQLNPLNPSFNNHLNEFMEVIEKIRLAVQSNLGLSAVARDNYESHHPILIKRGSPDFPLEKNGEVNASNILYDSATLGGLVSKHPPRVCIVKDVSGEDGLSILFKTKFRTFSMHIDTDGKVVSSLELNWKEIYDDLSPEIPRQQQALRSFTPWQRHSESNFFNGRSTSKVLTYLSEAFPSVFKYDSQCYYRDGDSEPLNLDKSNINKISSNAANLYVTLDQSLIEPAKDFNSTLHQPILAVIRRKSSLMGDLIQLVPGIYAGGKLHLVLHGHQDETEIKEIVSCDFEKERLHSWKWKDKPVILKSELPVQTAPRMWSGLHFLKHHPRNELVRHTAASPMVRASDAVMRKYWVSGFDIPAVYSEMITIADIFNTCSDGRDSPQEKLENLYYSNHATSSFRRFNYSEYELEHASHLAFQIVVPHDSANDHLYWGEQGENIARTMRMTIKLLLKMVPEQFHHKIRLAVNMCCPAAAIERVGGGFGLCIKPDYINKIVQAIKNDYPDISIEFKTLMLSDTDANKLSSNQISFANNKNITESLSAAGADGLVWQGKPRNQEIYDPQAVIDIAKSAAVRSDFKFGYSGMVATLDNKQLADLGYIESASPHYSVEGILEKVKAANDGVLPNGFEVMLGRVLLGSPWLLMGRFASDQEIMLLTLLQSFMLREQAIGAGPCGVDLMQIHILYNVRHITYDRLRDELMSKIFDAQSAMTIVNTLYDACVGQNYEYDIGAVSLLKPSILKLKTAIDRATAGEYKLYSDRENLLVDNQRIKKDVLSLRS